MKNYPFRIPDGYMLEESVAVGNNPCCPDEPYLLLIPENDKPYGTSWACCCSCGKRLTKTYENADDAMDEFEGIVRK